MRGCSCGASWMTASTASAHKNPFSIACHALRCADNPQRAMAPTAAAARIAHGAGLEVENAPQSSRTQSAAHAAGSAARAAHLRAVPVRGGIPSLELEEDFVLAHVAELLPRRPLQGPGLQRWRKLPHRPFQAGVLGPELAVFLLLPVDVGTEPLQPAQALWIGQRDRAHGQGGDESAEPELLPRRELLQHLPPTLHRGSDGARKRQRDSNACSSSSINRSYTRPEICSISSSPSGRSSLPPASWPRLRVRFAVWMPEAAPAPSASEARRNPGSGRRRLSVSICGPCR